MDTYWQSDGVQPHLINVQFSRKTTVKEVALYLDYKLDESYTPKKIAIRVGSTLHDLKEIHVQHIAEPSGWISIPLQAEEASEQVGVGSCSARRELLGSLLIAVVVAAAGSGSAAHVLLADRDPCDAPERTRHAHSTSEDLRAT
ncbi:unnamed protein product [Phytophthora fragariaefolia]|uniref:Unnamed protein product n=1 Tax=Phytophthora fragariaefolia TaxID=1490495 RepID=A0A9W6YI31_9STRA|nr:unnamed protein product [Phytophthora fragariaefolia]